jgi:aryl-alcohol dehydrogenase-like predicted oxidoreductase
MKLRQLGRPGPLVSEIGLGCMGMTFAYSTSGYADDRSVEVIHRALDLGVSLLDTADVYGPYTNEQVVGRALRNKKRDQVVLATKVGLVGERPGHLERNGRP